MCFKNMIIQDKIIFNISPDDSLFFVLFNLQSSILCWRYKIVYKTHTIHYTEIVKILDLTSSLMFYRYNYIPTILIKINTTFGKYT